MTKRTDIHVHMVGNSNSGSGCFLRAQGLSRLTAGLMLRSLGASSSALRGNLAEIYAKRLVQLVRESSLDAVVLLAMDWPYDEHGKPLCDRAALFVPNDLVINLAKDHTEFLSGISIHPARPDALDELNRLCEAGASLLKLLPNYHNVDCSLERHRPFWREMAKLNIPLLAHTGGELSLPVMNRSWENPQVLRGPLEEGVTVIAAHMASSSYPGSINYAATLREMFAEYPNLYGDISALCSPFRSACLRECLSDPFVLERIVHGSDVPIPLSPFWPFLRRALTWSDYWNLRRINNPLELDYQIKQACGFPEAVFLRACTLLNRA